MALYNSLLIFVLFCAESFHHRTTSMIAFAELISFPTRENLDSLQIFCNNEMFDSFGHLSVFAKFTIDRNLFERFTSCCTVEYRWKLKEVSANESKQWLFLAEVSNV